MLGTDQCGADTTLPLHLTKLPEIETKAIDREPEADQRHRGGRISEVCALFREMLGEIHKLRVLRDCLSVSTVFRGMMSADSSLSAPDLSLPCAIQVQRSEDLAAVVGSGRRVVFDVFLPCSCLPLPARLQLCFSLVFVALPRFHRDR
jgi:hypothetical protein